MNLLDFEKISFFFYFHLHIDLNHRYHHHHFDFFFKLLNLFMMNTVEGTLAVFLCPVLGFKFK